MDRTDDYLDEIGRVIIKDLCELKKKFKKKETEFKIYKAALFILSIVFIGYLFFNSIYPYRFNYGAMINKLINNEFNYVFIAVLITLYYRTKFIEKKTEKAENEYHALRREFIQRTEELWPEGEKREKRHLFLKEMKEKYDINLYYENE
ncbi:DUF2663 family protein [Calidifontibacillus erzurumensis]|uniref:DUF2663 family protein n=1 Tax=Calidifontibacillus erzurumensis TaxID=2741433 RepID=A0A8J8KAX3_9BACI|nr:DUF2663 family protein [Calidifontibacillus erzurumensis]NSL50498.1 DUF2663 family protein [Calidifontibacillus erzurumensis]